MRHRRWMMVVLCLSVSLLLLSQLSSASDTVRVDEARTRVLLEEKATKVSLMVVNPLHGEFTARVRLEVLDPHDALRASAESNETIKRGASTLVLTLPLQLAGLDKAERNEVLWYRLRYRISPLQTERTAVAPIEGIVSLSEITPDLFELRVAAPEKAREGQRYHAQARAVHPVSSRPVAGVKIEAELMFDDDSTQGTMKVSGVTNAEGFVPLDFDLPQKIADDKDVELKVSATLGTITEAAEEEIDLDRYALIMLSTDKPLYQPGQTLHLRMLCFDNTKHALAATKTSATIEDPEGTTVFRAGLTTSRFGVASLDWPIPDNARLGDYILKVELDDGQHQTQAAQAVKISRYELPNFAVNVKPDHPYYLPGQDAEVSVSAGYLFGQPVKRGRVRVVRETERTWNYLEQKWETEEGATSEGETDGDGQFVARLKLDKEHADLAEEDYSRFKDITYAAYFTDPTTNRTEVKRFDLRVTKDEIHIYIRSHYEPQTQGFPLQFYFSTFYADGTPAECEVEISDARSADGSGAMATKRQALRLVKTNSYGVAKVSGLALPQREDDESDQASLNFTAHDRRGLAGHQAYEFEYVDHPVIRLETNKALYRAGEAIKATVSGSQPEMKLVVQVWKNGEMLRADTIELRDGRAALTVPYQARFKEGVTLMAYALPDAETDRYDLPVAARQIVYPSARDLRLDVNLSQQTYRPGEEAQADFNVRTPDGQPSESALGVVIFDKAVEERARTDRNSGSSFGFAEAYNDLNGYGGELSGVSGPTIMALDMTKPIPAGLDVVAEILLRVTPDRLSIFGSDSYDSQQQQLFAKLTEKQTAALKQTLANNYQRTMEYPHDAQSLRVLLSAGGIDFDGLLDPWGTPYRARFSIERESDTMALLSAGADKRFDTPDDFTATSLSWLYFRPLGENFNRVVASYHARTSDVIHDLPTLKEELRQANIELDALRDRWGQPYRFDFVHDKTNQLIKIVSSGPDRQFQSHPEWRSDNFTVWTNTTDYFDLMRTQMDAALSAFTRATNRFPQNAAELRDTLSRSNINLDVVRDPWGHNYYAVFWHDSRYAGRQLLRSYSLYGEKGKLRQEVTPSAQQRFNYIQLRSRGEDNLEGTADDFDVANLTRTFFEQNATDSKPQVIRPTIKYSGASGAISGAVVDLNNNAAVNVKITATHLVNAQVYETTSDSRGRYLLRNLPVGLYKVEFTVSGFTTLLVDRVPVRSSNLTLLDTTLQVAAFNETVTVTAGPGVALETMSNSSGTNVSTEEFSTFTTQRTVQSLYSIAPGIVRGAYGAEYGRSTGGIINVITKSGTREQIETPRLRENFSETLVWQPSLETDSEGRARLVFKLADNITTWKMAVIGSTASGEVGLVEREIPAFQPFFVEHDPPRVLTEGDEIQLPVVVRNYLEKAQDVNLEIAPATWFTLLGSGQKHVTVPAGDSSRQTFDFRASAIITDGKQQITARAAGGGDAIVKPVSVHPDGEEKAATESQIISRAATLNLNLPADTIKDSVRAELKIYPNLMAHVFESIEGILHRPYGCGEQTISSTYPSLLVLSHDKRTNQHSPVAPKALRYLRAGYERLLNYRAESGGFSYWGGRSEADLALTAYALRFLSAAKEFIEVDESVITKAREWLITQQLPDGTWPTHYYQEKDRRQTALLTAYVARVLAATDENHQAAEPPSKPADATAPGQTKPLQPNAVARALVYLARRIDELDEPYFIAAYALAAREAGETAGAARAVAKLRALAHAEGDASYWSLETNTPFYGWGLAGRIETTALVVQALSGENKTDEALVNRGLLFLLRQKDRYGVWYSSQATINVLDALIMLLSKEPQDNGPLNLMTNIANAGQSIELIVNNRREASIPMPSASQLSSQITFDLTPFLTPGENRIELRRDGELAPASVQAVATYYVPWATTNEANPRSATANSSSPLKLEIGFDKSEVKIGDEVTCRVLAQRIGGAGYGMLLGEIGLPPGADVDRASLEKAMAESNWSFSRYDILPDRLVVYLWPRAGGTQFEFKFRPRYGLAAQTAASQLYDYYNPDARTVVAPTKFVVR